MTDRHTAVVHHKFQNNGVFFLMIRRPPRSTQGVSSAASDVYKRQLIWVQLFTSLTADLCQDINIDFAFSRCLNGTFPWSKYSVKEGYGKFTQKIRFEFVILLIWINVPMLTEQFLQGNVPLMHMLNAKPPFISWLRSAFNVQKLAHYN